MAATIVAGMTLTEVLAGGICFRGSFNPKQSRRAEPSKGVMTGHGARKRRVGSPPAQGKAGAERQCGLRLWPLCSPLVQGLPRGILEKLK